MHATVGVRVARQVAGVERDARPGEALGERHRRVVVQARVVVGVFLQDREHAGRRLVPGAAGGASRDPDPDAVAIHIDELIGERDDDRHRPRRRALGIPHVLAGLELTDVLDLGVRDRRAAERRSRDCQSPERAAGEAAPRNVHLPAPRIRAMGRFAIVVAPEGSPGKGWPRGFRCAVLLIAQPRFDPDTPLCLGRSDPEGPCVDESDGAGEAPGAAAACRAADAGARRGPDPGQGQGLRGVPDRSARRRRRAA